MRLQIAQDRPQASGEVRHGAGGIALFEIFVAALFVVGLFDAACQPFGWTSAVQFLLCGSLAPVLWLADRQLQRVVAATVDRDPRVARTESL